MKTFLLSILMLGCSLMAVAQHLDAAISYQFGRGGLTDYYGPQRQLQWSANVQTRHQINDRNEVWGCVGYSYSTGYEMAGSAWIDPTDKPFDLIEYTADCAGRKVLEQYLLKGGVSRKTGGWTIDLKAGYKAANYAKQRDLRHQNRQMEMELSPLLKRRIGRVSLGAAYTYRRRTEGVSFCIAGNTDQQYITLVSYGAFLGMREYSATLYDGYSSTSSGDRPLVDQWQGGALQADLDLNDGAWLNTLNVEQRSGYYGRETSYTIVYEDHEGNHLLWDTSLGISRDADGSWRHLWTGQLEYQSLNAKERLWNEVQQGGGLNEYVYYDHQQRLSRHEIRAELDYRLKLNDWTLEAGLRTWHQEQKVSYYPLFRRQDWNQYAAHGVLSRLWSSHRHYWEATFGLQWQWGKGTMAHDGTYGGATATTRTVSHDAYLRQAFDYRTARQGSIQVGLRYLHPQHWYLSASHTLRHCLDKAAFDNPSFNTLNLSLGYQL